MPGLDMIDFHRMRDVGPIEDIHCNDAFAFWLSGVVDVRTQLDEEQARLPRLATTLGDIRQPTDFLQ